MVKDATGAASVTLSSLSSSSSVAKNHHRFIKKLQRGTTTNSNTTSATQSYCRPRQRRRRVLFCLLFVILLLVLILSLVWTYTTRINVVEHEQQQQQDLYMMTTTTTIPTKVFTTTTKKNVQASNNDNQHDDDQSKRTSAAATTAVSSSCPWWKNDTCLHEMAMKMARIWDLKPYWHWCHGPSSSVDSATTASKNTTTTRTGILLVKLPKAASSTVAGLFMRIAHRHECFRIINESLDDNITPLSSLDEYNNSNITPLAFRLNVEWQHQSAYEAGYRRQQDNKDNDDDAKSITNSFLVAPVRSADARALSSVYYHSISLQPPQKRRQRHNNNNNNHQASSVVVSDSFILRQLQRQPPNYMVQYLRLDSSNDGSNETITTNDSSSSALSSFQRLFHAVQGILNNYDFLIITEELEASLIVLGWIMQIELKDLLVLSSKTTTTSRSNGGADSFYYNGRRCIRLVPPIRTPAIHEYFQKNDNNNNNNNWKTRHAADRLLHAAANYSLYQTIEHQLGWNEFRLRQVALRQLQHAANRACAAEIALQQPCIIQEEVADSGGGRAQFNNASQKACYIRDFGCGFDCYNRFVDQTTTAA